MKSYNIVRNYVMFITITSLIDVIVYVVYIVFHTFVYGLFWKLYM